MDMKACNKAAKNTDSLSCNTDVYRIWATFAIHDILVTANLVHGWLLGLLREDMQSACIATLTNIVEGAKSKVQKAFILFVYFYRLGSPELKAGLNATGRQKM